MSKKRTEDHLARVLGAIGKVKGLGDGAVGRLSAGALSQVREIVPTGVTAIDRWILGIGGFPVGRLTELASEEGGGKSSLLYSAIARAQRMEMENVVLLADSEQSLDEKRLASFGVDPDRLGLIGAERALPMEDLHAAMREALRAIPDGVGPNLLAWDSVAATPLRCEVDGKGLPDDAGAGRLGLLRANYMGGMCRELAKLAAEKRTALVFVNQLRERPGVAFGDNKYTPGGKAVGFFASVRLRFLGGKADKATIGEEEFHVGKVVTVMSIKNRLAPPWRKARVRLDYAGGWDDAWTTRELALTWGLVSDRKVTPEEALAALDGADWRPTALEVAEAIAGADEEDPD